MCLNAGDAEKRSGLPLQRPLQTLPPLEFLCVPLRPLR